MSIEPHLIYSRRAAQRLDKLLSELGFSHSLLDRSTGFSERVRLDRESCLQLLSGEVPWSWRELSRLCETFGKEPGFFLDHQHAPLPTAAITVPNAEGGESTVWCPPRGIGTKNLPPDAQLRHVTRLIPKIGVDTVGMYVFLIMSLRARDLRPGCQYVIDGDDGLEVASFDHSTNEAGIFTDCCAPAIHRITLPRLDDPIASIAGEVVGLIIVR